MAEQVEQLNAAPGAQIQRPLNGAAHGTLRQCQRGLPNTQNVILAQHARTLVCAEIAGHPQVSLRCIFRSCGPAVRAEVDGGTNHTRGSGTFHDAHFQQRFNTG